MAATRKGASRVHDRGLVFALLYYILKGIAQALYHETPWLVQMQGQEIEQSWAHIIAGLLSIACACAAAFCIVFAATRWVLS